MRKASIIVFVIATMAAAPGLGQGSVLLPVQGRLLDSDGQPIDSEDPLLVDFRLYDSPFGGFLLFDERQEVRFSDGYFVAYIGENARVEAALFRHAPELWLGVQVGSDSEMVPRIRVASAPTAAFAQLCGDAQTLGGLTKDAIATASDVNCSGCVSGDDFALSNIRYVDWETTDEEPSCSPETEQAKFCALSESQLVNPRDDGRSVGCWVRFNESNGEWRICAKGNNTTRALCQMLCFD